MDTKTAQRLGETGRAAYLDAVIEKGVVFLLIFTPFAFGSVQTWASAVMEIGAFIVLVAWLLKQTRCKTVFILDKGLIVMFGIFALIVALQLVPLPGSMLSLLSPKTSELHANFLGSGPIRGSVSVHPWATQQDFLRMLAYVAIFVVIINHYRTKKMINSLIKTIMFIAVSLVLFAIIQKLTWNGRLFWFYPVEAHAEARRNFLVWGPFINRNHFAGYLELVIPLGLGLVLSGLAKRKESINNLVWTASARTLSSSGLTMLTLWSAATLLMTGALFMTLSRGGIISVSCAIALFGFLASMRKGLHRKLRPLMMIGLALLVTLIIAAWDRIEGRFEQLGEERQVKRAEVWADSAGIIRDFPWLGTGLGTFGSIYPLYQSHSATTLYDHAHNDYVELITETGWIGFGAMMSMVFLLALKIVKAWLARHRTYIKVMAAGGISSCTAIGVHSFMDFNLHIPANALLMTVIAAVTYALVFNTGRAEDHKA